MSYACLILGESGTGKTCSLRNLDPKNTLLIQPVRKPLPFRSAGWKEIKQKGDGNNIFVCADPQKIINCMHASPFEVVVIDDFQYILLSLYMNRRSEKSYEKFSELAGVGYDVVRAASELEPNKRVYVLGHTATDDFGRVHLKTIGKMLDSVVVLEGFFTTVLRAQVDPAAGRFYFSTRNNGNDTVKAPVGMFEQAEIDNDLAAIDQIVCDYYSITTNKENEK
uniref:AAA domain protein n=1 Tax=Podoviridae sp. ctiwu7 TaxID=2825269 RepID=A0A8S5QCR9_9CAUD|nr:MAG TPA: AAA domain protein [Podoviridae sp. ctiwu7]